MTNCKTENKYNSEKGFVMLATLIIVLILLVLSASIMGTVHHGLIGSSRDLNRLKAFYIAEAGIERTKLELRTSKLDNILKGLDNTSGTGDDGILAFGSSVSFGNGVYQIKVADNDDGDSNLYNDNDSMVIVLSQGNLGNYTRTIRALMLVNPGNSLKAITVNGNLVISGNPHITGTNGSVHANGDFKIVSSPIIEQDATASGNYIVTGSPVVGGVFGGGFPVVNIPVVNPENYRSKTDYELRSNGNVYDKSGNFVTSGTFQGWIWSSGFPNKWTFSDLGGYQNSTYFIEGMAVVSGNPGSAGFPWMTTIIATDSIEISGNPVMETSESGLLFVAGRDLKINGNISQSFHGVMMAHEQLLVSGAPSLDGAIVIENAENISTLVTTNVINGDMNIQCDGDNYGIGAGEVTIKNWQEVLNSSS